VSDWKRDFVTSRIRGAMKLRANLFEPRSRKVFDTWATDLVLDDVPPQNALVDAAPRIPKGTTRLLVKATVTPPSSGITDVGFIVGPKDDFAKPDVVAKIIKGKRRGGDDSAWEGTLPISKDATGELVVTARFTSGVDLKTFKSAVVEVIEPLPAADEVAAAKPEPKKPGAIKGKVTENDVAQPSIEVHLIDLKPKDAASQLKKTTKTKPNGTYEFLDLDPGLYQVYCKQNFNGRLDSKAVTVPSGETVKQDLDLILH
jgi:hypothetical protein